MKLIWIILILIVAVLMLNNTEKKEGQYGFRCSDDKSSIEMYNKMTEGATVWKDCAGGTCKLVNGQPTCTIEESKKELGSNTWSYLLIAAIVWLFIFKKK